MFKASPRFIVFGAACLCLALCGGGKLLAQQPKAGDVITNKSGIKLAWIPPGGGFKGFHMGIYTVTQKQWQAIMGNNPSKLKGDDLPVEQVTWNECVEFCTKLSKSERKTYRLPTEAEWEYACRAGSRTKYYFGDNEKDLGDYAWFRVNSGNKAHPVGQKKPNAWGLYDMYGNVCQWTSSEWKKGTTSRAIRGSSWGNNPSACTAAYRTGARPHIREDSIGFRLARENTYKETIIGEWELAKVTPKRVLHPPVGAIYEFTRDGKWKVSGKAGGESLYEVQDDNLILIRAFDKAKRAIGKIKTLSDNELVIESIESKEGDSTTTIELKRK